MVENRLTSMGPRQKRNEAAGLYSVCSSHPRVLAAAFSRAAADKSELLIESTCNQVNQFRGYSGMTPADFTAYMASLADQVQFPKERLIIGGDHLGPHVWRSQPAETAMAKAETLVSQCVLAGYAKIHLDASMALGDDNTGQPDLELSAGRAARLCRAAEAAAEKRPAGSPLPVYVVGAEVPTPGGSLAASKDVPITDPRELAQYLDWCRKKFKDLGLEDAWSRVIAVVVQPGIDFGDTWVARYAPLAAADLSAFHARLPHSMTYEIHATDYQTHSALEHMVSDHFALLKTGPCLTCALREAVFAMVCIEHEWLGRRKDITLSGLREVLCGVMARAPEHWRSHHPGSGPEPDWPVLFSYLDRVRYYWSREPVTRALDRLAENLGEQIPETLIRQYLPGQYRAVARGALAPSPQALMEHKISCALQPYAAACRMDQNPK